MEMAGLILIGIGVNTFINGVWLLLYNSQTKLIENNDQVYKKKFSEIENSINKLLNKE